MANLNKVMLIGRLGTDPESISFDSGGKVTKFRFAVNNRKLNQSTQQWEDVPVWMDVKAFNRGERGTLADRVESTLSKGRQIFIEGHLVLETWTSKQDGGERSRLIVVMDNFQYLDPKDDNGMGGGRPARAPQQAASGGGGYGGNSSHEQPQAFDVPSSGQQEEDIPF